MHEGLGGEGVGCFEGSDVSKFEPNERQRGR